MYGRFQEPSRIKVRKCGCVEFEFLRGALVVGRLCASPMQSEKMTKKWEIAVGRSRRTKHAAMSEC